MLNVYSVQDAHAFKRIAGWAKPRWGKPYHVDTFMCAHPIMYLLNEAYGRKLAGTGDVNSALLANYWFTRGTLRPEGRDNLLLRFQGDTDAIGPLRPDGISHVELVLYRDPHTESGICLGVGVGALNNTFGTHPFAVGLAGDGWYDPSGQYSIHYRFIQPEAFSS